MYKLLDRKVNNNLERKKWDLKGTSLAPLKSGVFFIKCVIMSADTCNYVNFFSLFPHFLK